MSVHSIMLFYMLQCHVDEIQLEWLFIYDTYVKSGSTRKVRTRFQHKYLNIKIPNWETIHSIANKMRHNGDITRKMTKSNHLMLRKEKFNESGGSLEHVILLTVLIFIKLTFTECSFQMMLCFTYTGGKFTEQQILDTEYCCWVVSNSFVYDFPTECRSLKIRHFFRICSIY